MKVIIDDRLGDWRIFSLGIGAARRTEGGLTMPTERVKVNPCPFCGSLDLAPIAEFTYDDEYGFTLCNKCGAQGPAIRTDVADWRTEATRLWNKRIKTEED